MSFDDHFSRQAPEYSRYRPSYPERLFKYLAGLTKYHDVAWDCATGNGQAALNLATLYNRVEATDASEQQIANAVPHEKINYQICEATSSPFPDNYFDLITVAQALHWFDLDEFYKEVRRVSKPGGVFAAWCYGLFNISTDIDKLILHFYRDTVGSFWPAERKYIDQGYSTLPFPFERLEIPDFSMSTSWDLQQVTGYLGTWSAVRYYREHHKQDPIIPLAEELESIWGEPETQHEIGWPIYLHVGRVNK